MKRFLLFLAITGTGLSGAGQLVQTRTSFYQLPSDQPFEKVVLLKMPYAGAVIESITGDTAAMSMAGGFIIDVVCTDYPTEQSLARLNSNRLKTLYKRFPFISPATTLQLNCYRQLQGTEKERALTLFHGIVVRFRKKQTPGDQVRELSLLDSLIQAPRRLPVLKSVPPISGALPVNNPESVEDTRVPYYDPSMSLQGKRVTHIIGDTAWLRKKFLIPDHAVVLDFKSAYKKKFIPKSVYQRFRDRGRTWLTLYQPLEAARQEPVEPLIVPDTAYILANRSMPDSTLLHVLGRNQWSNYVIVGDVTGSMYPYTAQLLRWLQLQFAGRQAIRCVFFNDGDDRDDDKKKPGKTGGIYLRQCNRYEEAEALVKTAMQKGSGGDFPENTAEALFVAQERFPGSRHLILVADNWAAVRDRFLIKHLELPVHIILCGSHGNDIHPDYLALARATRGSLHTLEEDITGLHELKEGEQRIIGGRKFEVRNGQLTDAGEVMEIAVP